MKLRLFLLCTLAALAGSVRAEDLAIIVAKSVPLENVTSSELVQIFRCDKTSASDGTKLTIVTREKGAPERSAALTNIYKLSDMAYEKFFMQAVFTGRLTAAPRLIPSAASMKRITAAAPGTVGYVRASDIDDTVKVLKIDGLAPGESGYPLKLAN